MYRQLLLSDLHLFLLFNISIIAVCRLVEEVMPSGEFELNSKDPFSVRYAHEIVPRGNRSETSA